jgi:hypothetical protein
MRKEPDISRRGFLAGLAAAAVIPRRAYGVAADIAVTMSRVEEL